MSHKPYGPPTSVTQLQQLHKQRKTGTSTTLQKHTDLCAHDFPHSPYFWHRSRLTNIINAWSWRLFGINPAIYRWVWVYAHSFLVAVPDKGQWSTWCSGRFSSGEKPLIQLNRRLGGPSAAVDALEKAKICSCWGLNQDSSVFKSIGQLLYWQHYLSSWHKQGRQNNTKQ